MTVYAMVQLRFTDRARYERYQARFAEVFLRHDGTLLAADEHPQVLEGEWPHHKVVLMSFPDEAAFRSFSQSPDYEEIGRDRRAGAQAVILQVRGLKTPLRRA
jgi:uncharacterized protein (DUF1330 family)